MSLASILKILGGIYAVRDGLHGLSDTLNGLASPPAEVPNGKDLLAAAKQTPRSGTRTDPWSNLTATTEYVGDIDGRVQHIIKLIRKGKRSPRIQLAVSKLLNRKCGGKWCIAEKDHKAEIKEIFRWCRSQVRYLADPRGVDTFRSPERTLFDFHGGDCFVAGTLVLRDDYQLVPVESLRVGNRIWGLNKWSTVSQTWDRGVRPTWTIMLNNGGSMRLTPEHKVWVQDESGLRRVTVSNLGTGDRLIRPDRIPFGAKRATKRADGKRPKSLAVKSVIRDGQEAHCYDFETDDHMVWLPEVDWTTSQCDDISSTLSTLLAIALETAGYETRLRVIAVKPSPPQAYSHILVLVGLPQRAPEKWMPLDASVDKPAGWYPKDKVSGFKDYRIPA